jgi:hypothetical protein
VAEGGLHISYRSVEAGPPARFNILVRASLSSITYEPIGAADLPRGTSAHRAETDRTTPVEGAIAAKRIAPHYPFGSFKHDSTAMFKSRILGERRGGDVCAVCINRAAAPTLSGRIQSKGASCHCEASPPSVQSGAPCGAILNEFTVAHRNVRTVHGNRTTLIGHIISKNG